MQQKRLSKDRTAFGIEVNNRSAHFSRAITKHAGQCPADETSPTARCATSRRSTTVKRTAMIINAHLDASISGRPKPNCASEPPKSKENAIALNGRAAASSTQ
jgi:hypothetical protein